MNIPGFTANNGYSGSPRIVPQYLREGDLLYIREHKESS